MPRKPVQKRAQATVEAIVEAGFICVARKGIDGTTTRHIADAAGIGVGSLYEYFSDKEAIYQVMYTRLLNDIAAEIKARVPRLVTLPITDAIRHLLQGVGQVLQANDKRYLRCARHALQADIKLDTESLTQTLTQVLMQYVLHQPRYMKVRNIPTMTYIFIHGGIYTLMHHLSERNPPMDHEVLMEGLATMVGHYAEHELALVATLERESSAP